MLEAPGREFAAVTASGPVLTTQNPTYFASAAGQAAGLSLWDQTPAAVVFRDDGGPWTNGKGEALDVIQARLAARGKQAA